MKALKWILAGVIIFLIAIAVIFYKADIPVEELKKKYANEESQFISMDGMEVHYRDEGSGFPLVLLHGTASSLHTWDGWTFAMKNHFRLVRMDLPAFGLTGPNPQRDYTIPAYVDFVNEFLENLDLDSFYLAGNSLGGEIAWNYALAHPEKVKKMILVDAAGYPTKVPGIFRLARKPWFAEIMKRFTPEYIVTKNLKEVYGDNSKVSQKLIDRHFELSLRTGNRQAFVDRAHVIAILNTEQIKEVKTPTLIQWGELDTWIPLDFGKQFNRDIAGSKLLIYKGAGHVPMEEKPEDTSNDAITFLLN